MEFQGARENNIEKEEVAVMEERIYVAVGNETAKNKSNLTWAIDNSDGNKICIVLVHQPAQMIPVCKFFLSPFTPTTPKVHRFNGCVMKQSLKSFFLPFLSPVGTKFHAATVDEELVRTYREKQKAKTEKILDEYLRICLQKGVCLYIYIYKYEVSAIS